MASEETKILEIKVEYQEAIKKIGEYKTKIDEIKDAESRYKKEVKEGTITQQEYNERITAAKVKTNEYKTAIKVLEKQVTSQIKTQKSNADIMEEVNGLLGVNAKSIAEAQAANKALREAVRNLSDEDENAYAIRQKLNAQIDENTRYIQRNSDEYIKQKMNIGNYTESIKQAYVEIKNGGVTMQTVGIIAQGFAKNLSANVARGFSDVTHAGTRMAGAIRLVSTALAATGIGLVVAALAALAAAFTRTQKGMEFFQVTAAKVGAVVDVLFDRIAESAKNITSVMSSFGNAFLNLLKLDFSGAWNSLAEGSGKAIEAFAGMGEEMKNEWQLAGDLKESLIEIEKAETMLGMKRAANRAEIEKLKMVSEDVTKSTKERQEAAKKAFDMERELMTEEISLQERRIANQLGFTEVTDEVRQSMKDIATGAISADEAISKLGISSSTIDDLKTFSEDVKELYDKTESSTTRQIELQNKLNSISKEGKEKQLALTEKELAAVREMEDALLGVIQNEKEKERKALEMSYDREIEDLKKRLQTEKDLTEKAKDAILATIKAKEQAKEQELSLFDSTNTEEEYKKEYERQQKLAQARLEAMESNSEEELALKRKINELAMNEELRQYADDEEMKLAIKEQYLAKDAALVKAYDDNKLREKEEAKQKELAIEEAKYQGMKAVTGSLIDLIDAVGESSKASAIAAKVIALAQIAIDTGIAISKAVSTSAAKGFWGFLAEVGPFIAAIVANMANAIKSVKGAKFATGGDVIGAGTGTSDSIPAMLSNGESVLTAKATSMFAPILSAMNQAGGGVPINGQKTGNQAMGEDMLARAFAKGVAGLPNPVVSVVDINNTAKRVEVIENINVI